MGIMGPLSPIPKDYANPKMDALIAYEKHYMDLLARYRPHIEEILKLQAELREEEKTFWEDLPKIEAALKNEDVLSQEIKEEWLRRYHDSMKESFHASQQVIEHFVTKSLEDFKKELQKAKDWL